MARILVVDDEIETEKEIVEILESAGYEAMGVSDSRKVPSLLKKTAFDVVITDILMPEKEGS